jgi:hypothetical protein
MKYLAIFVALSAGLILSQACDSNSDSRNGNCWQSGDSCACGNERPSDAIAFAGTCDEKGFGERGICCKSEASCFCLPVSCGIASDGICECGLGTPGLYAVDTCEGTASTCCTQDTGYCYCEEGCQNRYANRVVSSCNQMTSAATCGDYGSQVTSCQ